MSDHIDQDHIAVHNKLVYTALILEQFFFTCLIFPSLFGLNVSVSRDILSLSDEELRRRVMGLKSDLSAIYTGRLHSDRHKRYMEGGNSRRKLCDLQICFVMYLSLL